MRTSGLTVVIIYQENAHMIREHPYSPNGQRLL